MAQQFLQEPPIARTITVRPLLFHEERIVKSLLTLAEADFDWQMPTAVYGCHFASDEPRIADINGGFTLFFEDTSGAAASSELVAGTGSSPVALVGELFLVGNRATS